METPVMSLVVAFIGVSIMLGVGVSILGGVNNGFDCSNLEGYDSTTPADSTEWAEACLSIQEQTQNSYNLLIVILVVIAAIAILVVVRML